MLTREQIYTMLLYRECEGNIFSALPDELICHISDMNNNPENEINIALRLADSGLEKDIASLLIYALSFLVYLINCCARHETSTTYLMKDPG